MRRENLLGYKNFKEVVSILLFFRGSWGSSLPCLFFLLGLSKHESVNDKVEKEKEEENDIILYPELDSYSNLTHKVFVESHRENIWDKNVTKLIRYIFCHLHIIFEGIISSSITEQDYKKRQYTGSVWRWWCGY